MLTKLIILGIINRRRHYGYEIKKTIEFELEDFDIKFGSIYHALEQFLGVFEDGWGRPFSFYIYTMCAI